MSNAPHWGQISLSNSPPIPNFPPTAGTNIDRCISAESYFLTSPLLDQPLLALWLSQVRQVPLYYN